MKKQLFIIALCTCILGAKAVNADYNVVPLPQKINAEQGAPFTLSKAVTIVYEGTDEQMKANAQFLSDYISQATGIRLDVIDKKDKKRTAVCLAIDPTIS